MIAGAVQLPQAMSPARVRQHSQHAWGGEASAAPYWASVKPFCRDYNAKIYGIK